MLADQVHHIWVSLGERKEAHTGRFIEHNTAIDRGLGYIDDFAKLHVAHAREIHNATSE